MDIFSDVIITKIKPPITVYSYQGKTVTINKRETYGLSFCQSGQITYTFDGQKTVSDTSCAIILPKGKTYSLHGDKEGFFPVINFECDGLDCDRITAIPLTDPEACIADYEKLIGLFLFDNNRLKIYAAFYELIDKIQMQQSPSSTVLKPALNYIEEHISNSTLRNADIAKAACISEVYLRRLFIKEFGSTPKQYIIDVRLKKAKQMLTQPAIKISAVAEECGFSSVYHFCREFKTRLGTTPSKYAKTNKTDVI